MRSNIAAQANGHQRVVDKYFLRNITLMPKVSLFRTLGGGWDLGAAVRFLGLAEQ